MLIIIDFYDFDNVSVKLNCLQTLANCFFKFCPTLFLAIVSIVLMVNRLHQPSLANDKMVIKILYENYTFVVKLTYSAGLDNTLSRKCN